MNKPANRCGCTHTHTHTHTYIFTKKLAKVAKVCLLYSEIGYKKFEKVCKLNCNIQNETCKKYNKKIKSKKHYEYMKIGVV